MSEWDLRPGDWRDSNPLGYGLQGFMEDWVEYVLYLRLDSRFKCPEHFSQATESRITLDVSCDCWGLGIKPLAQIAPARLSRGGSEMGSKRGDKIIEPGSMDFSTDVAHFSRAVAPKIRDYVLICEWNKRHQDIPKFPVARPTRITSIYLIKEINPHHQRELGWFSCGLDLVEFDRNLLNQIIKTKLSGLSVIDTAATWNSVKDYW